MGVSIPTTYTIDHVGNVGPVAVEGIPSTFDINIDRLPKISLGIDPIDISLRLKEVPSIRTHLPADFHVGLSILGFELVCLRLCGEGQLITEPYRPNPCEICGEPRTVRPSATQDLA